MNSGQTSLAARYGQGHILLHVLSGAQRHVTEAIAMFPCAARFVMSMQGDMMIGRITNDGRLTGRVK